MTPFSKLMQSSALALIGAQGPLVVWAQGVEPITPSTLERVEVTGSAIRRTAAEGALPVTVLRQEDIKRSGATSITDLIQMLPQMQGFIEAASSVNGGGGGITTAALHSLPSKYTLVLLDGQRVAPLSLSKAKGGGEGVNLESIPIGAIDHIDVLTDGASALYGSDAIAGVVNFITKKNSHDGDVSITLTHPQRSGGSSWNASLSKGFGDLDTNGFNFLFALGHDNQERLQASQRAASKRGAVFPFSANGTNYIFNGATSNTEPANLTLSARPVGSAPNAGYTSYSINPYYRANGNCGTPLASVITDADGTGALGSVGESCRFNYAATVQDIPQSRRDTALSRLTVKINDDTTGWASMTLSDFSMKAQYAPGAQPLGVSPTNNAALYNRYILPFLATNNLEVKDGSGLIGYRTVGLGGRTDEYRTTGSHLAVGVDGFFAGFDYSISGVLSTTELTDTAAGGYSDYDQFSSAVANGTYDPFAGLGDSALAGAVLGTQFQKTISQLSTLRGQVQHDLFNFGLGADAVKLAVGGEYAYQRAKSEYDALELAGSGFSTQPNSTDVPIGGTSAQVPSDSSRHSYGLFGELAIPVVKQFEMTASIRYDHYSKVHSKDVFGTNPNPATGLIDQLVDADLGNTFQATTGKLSAKFTPIEQLALRASYATGFKAPNFSDVAGPLTYNSSTAGTYKCPFPGASTCIAGSAQYDLLAGGNGLGGESGLKPEKSKQWSIGFVAEPLRGLSARADVWDVKLTNQILSSGIPEQVAFNNPGTYAGLFVNPYLDPVGQFQTIALSQAPLNGGTAEYRGLDWALSYAQKFDVGIIGAQASGTQMFRQQYNFGSFDPVYRSSVGKYGEDQTVVFRTILNLSVSLDTHGLLNLFTAHYRSGYRDQAYSDGDGVVFLANTDGTLGAPVAYSGRVPSYTTLDWQGKYTFNKALQLTLGVRNLFDRQPPFSLQSGGGGNQIGYDGRYADPLGRAFYLKGEYHF